MTVEESHSNLAAIWVPPALEDRGVELLVVCGSEAIINVDGNDLGGAVNGDVTWDVWSSTATIWELAEMLYAGLGRSQCLRTFES